MQHVVNIAFDFDDERVKKILEDTTVDKIQKDIREAVIDQLFEKRWGNKHANPETDPLREWVKNMVRETLFENRDYICQLAAKELAESMKRSQKWQGVIASQMASIVKDPFHDVYSNGKASTLQNRREEDE